MLYDLNFLKTGEVFPPREELERLDAYRVNDMLLNDEPWTALPNINGECCFYCRIFR